MLQLEISDRFSIGILKVECDVRPPGRMSAAMPKDATHRTIEPTEQRR